MSSASTVVNTEAVELIKSLVGAYPEWPVPGVLFRDIFPIFQSPKATEALFELFIDHIKSLNVQIDAIVGLEARGFLIGAAIAPRLNTAFVPIRKPGKLPGQCVESKYEKEYGADVMQIQQGSIKPGMNVIIVDDLLATGGTLSTAVSLVKQCGGQVVQCCVLIELDDLQGRKRTTAPIHAFIHYDN